jgi:hypothetical protein|tara:strand:- start:9 stop:281 length:273 start_codon:yes stop_codon:yes gene_type:complete
MKQDDIKNLKPFTLIVGAISTLIIIVLMISSGDTSLFGISERSPRGIPDRWDRGTTTSIWVSNWVLMIILSWFPYFIIKIIEVYERNNPK